MLGGPGGFDTLLGLGSGRIIWKFELEWNCLLSRLLAENNFLFS